MTGERGAGEIQKKTCPQCRQETFGFLLTCPACGFKWPNPEPLRERPDRGPGFRLLVVAAIALLGLLGAFCLLYVLALLLARRTT